MEGSAGRIASAPSDEDRARCKIFAFVGQEVLDSNKVVDITCNCGTSTPYGTDTKRHMLTCDGCAITIGIFGIEGGGKVVVTKKPDGSEGTAPIQGR